MAPVAAKASELKSNSSRDIAGKKARPVIGPRHVPTTINTIAIRSPYAGAAERTTGPMSGYLQEMQTGSLSRQTERQRGHFTADPPRRRWANHCAGSRGCLDPSTQFLRRGTQRLPIRNFSAN